ncbi:MAG: HDIG domain-containing protein [Proteobacteria bacterium]|nr:MAG: HDIG domain-containing protein [Pseudomonadota bacterium]
MHTKLEELDHPTDLSPYIISSPLPIESLLKRLEIHINSVKDPALQALLKFTFVESLDVRHRFITYPAALKMHHAWQHGLLQHSLEVADTVAALANLYNTWGYKHVSFDLAVTGALLHDIGKIKEMALEHVSYISTHAGDLNGHIILGTIFLARQIASVRKRQGCDFSETLEHTLMHLITSHHGK